jgi:hypothetical protein
MTHTEYLAAHCPSAAPIACDGEIHQIGSFPDPVDSAHRFHVLRCRECRAMLEYDPETGRARRLHVPPGAPGVKTR